MVLCWDWPRIEKQVQAQHCYQTQTYAECYAACPFLFETWFPHYLLKAMNCNHLAFLMKSKLLLKSKKNTSKMCVNIHDICLQSHYLSFLLLFYSVIIQSVDTDWVRGKKIHQITVEQKWLSIKYTFSLFI